MTGQRIHRHVERGFVVFGLASMGVLIYQAGRMEGWLYFQKLGWRFPILLALSCLWHLLGALAWRCCFVRERPSFARLFQVRLAGEAFSGLGGLSCIGREWAKFHFLSDMPTERMPALVRNKALEMVSGLAYVLTGFLVGLKAVGLLRAWNAWVGGMCLALCALAIYWIWMWMPEGLKGRVRRFSQHLKACSEPKGWLSATAHLASWLLGTLEIYVILWAVGHPLPFGAVWGIHALLIAIKTLLSILPTDLGFWEGGHMLMFQALGLGMPLGLGLGLIRRLRKSFWVLLGFLCLLCTRMRTKPASVGSVGGI